MELLTSEHFKVLANPGVESVQLLSPHNAGSTRLTITKVTVAPGAEQPRHMHASSEQIWIAVSGSGTLLLAADAVCEFKEGQVARFADGDIHGFRNSGPGPFVYLSVTSPPIDFTYAYKSEA